MIEEVILSVRPCVRVSDMYSAHCCPVVTATVKLFKSLKPVISGPEEDKHDLSVQGTGKSIARVSVSVPPAVLPSFYSFIRSFVQEDKMKRFNVKRS